MYRDNPSIPNDGAGGSRARLDEGADGLHRATSTPSSSTAGEANIRRRKVQWGKRCITLLLVAPFLFLIVYCTVYILGEDQPSPLTTTSTSTTINTTERTGESLQKEAASSSVETTHETSANAGTNDISDSSGSSGNKQDTPQHHDKTKGCLPDRFDNEGMDLTVDPDVNFGRLHPGQFICSKPYRAQSNSDKIPQRYRFGLSAETLEVLWQDTHTNETIVVMERPDHVDTANEDSPYFTLTTDATMVYHYTDERSNTTKAIERPYTTDGLNHPMQVQPSRCLSNHDCPYFHLHSEGVMVLNYIAADGTGWEARNFKRAYGLN